MTANDRPDHDDPESFASPPCFMHEVEPAYGRLPVDSEQERDVARWRKIERARLIAARMASPISEREEAARLIARDLDTLIADCRAPMVSLYWPFRGEPDLRFWMAAASAKGWRIALPIVVAKAQPLEFREWTPGARMERGVWNIPFPADGAIVTPTVVIAPLVGFDRGGYRLGHGGGYFDRTLAVLAPKPLIIGVGYPLGALPTIYPQWHDIPMDWIITGGEPPFAGKCHQSSAPLPTGAHVRSARGEAG